MKTRILDTTTSSDLSSLLSLAVSRGATHCHVMKDGGKRGKILKIDSVVGECFGFTRMLTFGTKKPGLPFERLDDTTIGQPPPNKEDTLAPAPKKVDPKAKVPKVRQFSGFIAAIDELLLTDGGKGKVEGFNRSKYSVSEALEIIMKKFPYKNPISVKKIIKVRPRHLEMIKGVEAFDTVKKRAPRWAFVGSGGNNKRGLPKKRPALPAFAQKPKVKTSKPKVSNAEKRKRYAVA